MRVIDIPNTNPIQNMFNLCEVRIVIELNKRKIVLQHPPHKSLSYVSNIYAFKNLFQI